MSQSTSKAEYYIRKAEHQAPLIDKMTSLMQAIDELGHVLMGLDKELRKIWREARKTRLSQ